MNSKEANVNKNSYIHKSTMYKKNVNSGSVSTSINFLNFLNNFQGDVVQSTASPLKDTSGIGVTNQKINSNRKSAAIIPSSSSNYLNSLSNLSKLVQNKYQNNTSTNQNFFNTRLTNLCELVNKSIKEIMKDYSKDPFKENQQYQNAISSEKIREVNLNVTNNNNLLVSAGK